MLCMSFSCTVPPPEMTKKPRVKVQSKPKKTKTKTTFDKEKLGKNAQRTYSHI